MALLKGATSDVFAPSKVLSGSDINKTTRIAVTAADLDDNGVDEVVRATTTDQGDILLSVTGVDPGLKITGNSTTQQIPADMATGYKWNLNLIAGNFDADAHDEVLLTWPEGDGTTAQTIHLLLFDSENGQLSITAEYEFKAPSLFYDVVLVDLDLDGRHEIGLSVLTEVEGSVKVNTLVLKNENIGIIEKSRYISTGFTGSIPEL